MASWATFIWPRVMTWAPARLPGTCRQYSKKAMPQLTAMAIESGAPRWVFRCPYQAKVMKRLEAVSRRRKRSIRDVEKTTGPAPRRVVRHLTPFRALLLLLGLGAHRQVVAVIDGVGPLLARADADHIRQRVDEDLAVAGLAGLAGLSD